MKQASGLYRNRILASAPARTRARCQSTIDIIAFFFFISHLLLNRYITHRNPVVSINSSTNPSIHQASNDIPFHPPVKNIIW
jgi:hypothetical protein